MALLAEKIASLDLAPVVGLALKTRRWSKARAERTATDYRRFLYLTGKHPHLSIYPWSPDLLQFWHLHILDTRKYAVDCNMLFGKYIHHHPLPARSSEQAALARITTEVMFKRAFMDEDAPKPADAKLLWQSAESFVSC